MTNEINKAAAHEVDASESNNEYFQKLAQLNVLSCNFMQQEGVNPQEAIEQCKSGIAMLGAKNTAEQMLAAQMLSNHNLQQLCMAMANKLLGDERGQFYVNAAIKLSNSFTNQVALLAKLHGKIDQHIVVQRVDVRDGGQAAFMGGVSKESNQ